jgi:glycosyltransferase involved in cell wall biosynthesis
METEKILFICPTYSRIGGVEKVTSTLVDFFTDKGFDVFILVSGEKIFKDCADNIHFNMIYLMEGELNTERNIGYIEDFIKSHKIKYVFNQGVFSEIKKSPGRLENIVLINTLHSCPFWEIEKFKNSSFISLFKTEKTAFKKFKLIFRYFLFKLNPYLAFPSICNKYRFAIENPDYYVVLNELYKKDLEDKLYGGKSVDKLRVIQNPLDLPDDNEFQKEKIILYAGRLVKVPKRVDKLLEIWSNVCDNLSDWNLIILGDGEEKANLERLSVEMQLKRVLFEGFQPAEDYYSKAAILCLTSDYEGAPLVISEAQSYGVVPITFDCSPGIKELVINGVDGIIVERGNNDVFSRELLKLASDDELRKKMQNNCQIKSREFATDHIGLKWLELMKLK